MWQDVIVKVIETIPSMAWVLLATVAFFALRSEILPVLRRTKSFSFPFGTAHFSEGIELIQEGAARTGTSVSPRQSRAVVSRLDHAAEALEGGRLLWVDDLPGNNRPIVELLQRGGLSVDLALNTAEGLTLLQRHHYDVVITDLRRGDDPQAGMRLIEEMSQLEIGAPILVFTGSFDPMRGVHPEIFGYTTDVDELVHYVIDVMERVRFRKGI
ncbi:response regulator [Melissospora conviva]|uniref:response regulator n=1 Tax=Melissospora conviva TaxID=3388432 RepID=UPI003C1400FF